MQTWKLSINAAFFGGRHDRFNQYQPPRTLEERFALIAQVAGVTGVELKYPQDFEDITLTRNLLERHALTLSAVNVNTKSAPPFLYGALSAQKADIRAQAAQLLREGMDIAADFRTDIVTTCPLADGYDYAFQIDYTAAWDAFIGTLKSVVTHRDDVKLVLEYQPHEPHARILLNNVGKMLHVCAEVDAPNFGANLDIGHAFAAGESPAESAALLSRKGWLRYLHSNDNIGDGGDWDMMSGTVHFWDWLDLLYTLDRIGYDGWISGDIQPKHFGPAAAYRTNFLMIQRMTALLERVGTDKLAALIAQEGHTPELYAYLSEFIG